MMNDSTRTAAADSEPGKQAAITTGEPRVDEALARLAGLGGLPDAGHIEAFEHVYQRLHGLLGELDTPGHTLLTTVPILTIQRHVRWPGGTGLTPNSSAAGSPGHESTPSG